MKYPTMLIGITAVLLSVLILFCGCTRPVSRESEDFDAPEIQIDETEPDFLPMTEASDTVLTTELLTVPAVTETVAAADTAAPIKTAETVAETTAAVPAAPVRIAVPRMASRPLAEAREILDAAGISYTVTEQYSAAQAAGNVITVRFYGALDDECCHINPNYPVEVVVSRGSRTRINAVAVDEKRIYLTFDDGPHKNTDRVLEILEQYGIRATFFTIGRYVAVYPDRAKAIVDGGHLIACHSYSHDYYALYESAESVLEEIHAWERTVEKAGVTLPETVYFRFPGGSTTYYMDRSRYEEVFWAVTDAGYPAIDWTCANNDRYLNGMTEDQTLQDYLLQSTAVTLQSIAWCPSLPKIMLMHDTADETVDVLPQILDYLIGEGYTFGTLDELDGYWVFP